MDSKSSTRRWARRCTEAIAIVVLGIVVANCDQQAAVSKGPAADYQAPTQAVPPPANLAAVCYTEDDLAAFRVRMVQQSLVVGVLICKDANQVRLLDAPWGEFVKKYDPELSANFRDMQVLATRKRVNYDVLITEVANRTGGRPATDPLFCSRQQRAFDWALSPKVNTLKLVPSPYDFGPEMNIHACNPS